MDLPGYDHGLSILRPDQRHQQSDGQIQGLMVKASEFGIKEHIHAVCSNFNHATRIEALDGSRSAVRVPAGIGDDTCGADQVI